MSTLRQKMIEMLKADELTIREISSSMGVKDKEVVAHLSNIARTVAAQEKKLIMLPFNCLACGYEFKERKRLKKPGKCPKCKESRVEEPFYTIR